MLEFRARTEEEEKEIPGMLEKRNVKEWEVSKNVEKKKKNNKIWGAYLISQPSGRSSYF